MEHTQGRKRSCGRAREWSTLAAITAASLVANPSGLAEIRQPSPSANSGSSLKSSSAPTTLKSLARRISRARGASFSVAPGLAEARVVWFLESEPEPERLLAHLAELLGGRINRVRLSGERSSTLLTTDSRTARLERWWRFEGVSRTVRIAVQVGQCLERGEKPPALPTGLQEVVALGYGPQLSLLQHLGKDDIDRLLEGEAVSLPAAGRDDPRLEEYVRSFYSKAIDPTNEETQEALARDLGRLRRDGPSYQFDLRRFKNHFNLRLYYGPPGKSLGLSVCVFGDDEIGLPATRSNPYDVLKSGVRQVELAGSPEGLTRRLKSDIPLPQDESVEVALERLARESDVSLVADSYVCRLASRGTRVGAPPIPRGTTIADALDQICRAFGYLWWEKGGCVFLRARAWVWDRGFETPESFLDTWRSTLQRRHTLGPKEIGALGELTPMQYYGLPCLGGRRVTNGLDSSFFAQFFDFFRTLTPAEQRRVLGEGLVIPPERVRQQEQLLSWIGSRPAVLRLTQSVRHRDDARLAAISVHLEAICQQSGEERRSGGAIEIPCTPELVAG